MVAANLSEGIAFQIRATRDAQGMTQAALAEAAGMSPNNLSRLENPDYGKHSLSSLKRIADALDVALVVRFVPYSQYIDWLSGTPRIDRGLSSQSLAVPNFDRDSGLNQADGRLIQFPSLEKPANEPPTPAKGLPRQNWDGGFKGLESLSQREMGLPA
jgi:transcriptional regulator with XRE-family HTH domain